MSNPSCNSVKNELDLISRQEAIGIIRNWLNFEGYSYGEKNVMKCAINELIDLPSVNTEKTGRCKRGFGNTSCTCSECGGNGEYIFKFCPHCGAKMEVEE